MRRGVGLVLAGALSACSGSQEEPERPSQASSTAAVSSESAPVVVSNQRAQAPLDVVLSQASESGAKLAEPQLLETLFGVGATDFPAPKFTDIDCTNAVGLTGDGHKDYDALATACGTGTGMRAFTKKVLGKLDASAHPTEAFTFTMLGRLCYRMFLVGDEALTTINVRMERPNGALLAVMSGKHSVVLVEPKDLWCADTDEKFRVVLHATGGSAGKYAFGIWARPEPTQ